MWTARSVRSAQVSTLSRLFRVCQSNVSSGTVVAGCMLKLMIVNENAPSALSYQSKISIKSRKQAEISCCGWSANCHWSPNFLILCVPPPSLCAYHFPHKYVHPCLHNAWTIFLGYWFLYKSSIVLHHCYRPETCRSRITLAFVHWQSHLFVAHLRHVLSSCASPQLK